MKTALITGITGQVGSYLAEHLLELGYIVSGVVRRSSNFTTERIEGILDKIELHYGDVTDMGSILSIIKKVRPDEIYNLAAQSHVKVSEELEGYTMQVNTIGVLNILTAIRTLEMRETRVLQASTSEMYGNYMKNGICDKRALDECSKMEPVSIYGISKLAGYNIVKYYRDGMGFFACNSISFNHESERRGKTFVTRKITEYVKGYKKGNEELRLGNLEARRDWSHTEDIVRGMVRILNAERADDYVLASGKSHSVREFVEMAFRKRGYNIEWEGEGIEEIGKIGEETVVRVDARYYRSIDINDLVGDSSKARSELGWVPKISCEELIERMTSE